jgi:error-prone DNA polymerase
MRQSALRPGDLAEAVAQRGMRAVGIADRDGLYGAVRAAQACAAAGIQAIFGADLALAPDDARPGWAARVQRGRYAGPGSGPAWLDDEPARVTLVARTNPGYANLCRTVSDAHLESTRGTPRLSWDQLERRPDAQFVLLGDDSPAGRLLDAGRADAAEAEVRRWMDLYGPSSVLIGVTHHLAPGDDARARARFALADELGLRAVADQRPRYLDPAQARIADVLDAVRSQAPLGARTRTRRNDQGYLKDPGEMARVFAERPDALANAAWAAEQCDAALPLGRLHVPDFVAMGEHAQRELRARTEAGMRERYPDPGPLHWDTFERELAMCERMGLAAYFLTVAEIVARIREKGIIAACRGSAAGSILVYALRISDVDPIAHDLAFERFMNPYRDELPDIDIDVEAARREDIYRDILERYGDDRVACVAMIETFQARMAIREVGKAIGLPQTEIDVIAKAFPHVRARDVRKALDHLPELRGRNLDRADLHFLFTAVEALDGLPRHIALHPSGVLLADRTLRDFVPMEHSAHGFAMAQFDKDDVEALGLCKLDVLAVRMLSSMAHCVDEVRRVRGVELDLSAIPWTDEDTYELIRSTRTLGMFQIESPGQRDLIGRLQPEVLHDLVVDISLFRPGPVKGDMVRPFIARHLGREPVVYPHPILERALAETHGVIVFHEQVMRCVAAVTGCDLAVADLVRRRLSDAEQIDDIRNWILASARERGMDDDTALKLWRALEQFASFGFCKAHAAAFAVPTWRSAWLKRHYLPEFVAGLLTHDPGMYPRRLLLEDARQLGVLVLPVDVNASGRDYRVERLAVPESAPSPCASGGAAPSSFASGNPFDVGSGRGAARAASAASLPSGFDLGVDRQDPSVRYAIRLALKDVVGMDERMVESLLAGRPFTSVEDLRDRSVLSAPVAGALAHVGAMDSLAPDRSRRDIVLDVQERWQAARTRAAACRPVQGELVSEGAAGLPDYTLSERVRAELDVLGMDVSAHVIDFYRPLLAELGVTPAAALLDQSDGRRVRVAGVKVATQTPPIRSGQRVVFLSLDDGSGVGDLAFFEHVLDRCAQTVFHAWLLVVEGRVRHSGGRGVSVNADSTWDLRDLLDGWRDGRLDDVLRRGRREGMPPRVEDGKTPTLWHRSGGSAG